MATVTIYSQERQEVGEITLSEDVFQVPVKPEILHLAVRSHLAKERAGTVGVKTRGTISGGGKKPWRQKGTGRARAGSTRSPLWRGGAVVHGPVARSYGFKINKKVRKLAVKMALSSRLAEEKLTIVDKITLAEIKTKGFLAVKDALQLKKALIVVSELDNNLRLSARNVPGIDVLNAESVNTYDILRHPQLVLEQGVVERLQERLK
jgi:large subunit ribosomal protein L4